MRLAFRLIFCSDRLNPYIMRYLITLLFIPLLTMSAATVDDLTFSLDYDGASYVVSDCNTSATGHLLIPATYNSLPVTRIGWRAFSNCSSLTSITIPDSIEYVDATAFEGSGVNPITKISGVSYLER